MTPATPPKKECCYPAKETAGIKELHRQHLLKRVLLPDKRNSRYQRITPAASPKKGCRYPTKETAGIKA
ncbi:hypothetical protein [Chitinophaga sp.]|uniref:hypothetical protein n=1 Tax=Chitinophaga sp. TaxID=1869181 RepID=UPI0031D893BD